MKKFALAILVLTIAGGLGTAQGFPAGTGSCAHDLDDDAADVLLYVQQNYGKLTSLVAAAQGMGDQADTFHDFVHDVDNNKNGRKLSETGCEFHRLFRAAEKIVAEVATNWTVLSTDTTFNTKYNKMLSAASTLVGKLLGMKPVLIYFYTGHTEHNTHKLDDEAADILLHLQQNYPSQKALIALAVTFANDAAAFHSVAHDVSKCIKPTTAIKPAYGTLTLSMFTFGQALVNASLFPGVDSKLDGLVLNSVGYYVAITNGFSLANML